ncbi:biotin/lipoyl-binding protein [Chromobacterium haemolyticum]|nr:biotin/lipoyl-binding protein [Chromobacterium haemolyticum]
MQTNTLIRYLTTLLLLALAVWLGKALWDHYMHSPWTRDGRVRADVITLSADVAGLVTQVAVKDNQPVHKGDVLFVWTAPATRRRWPRLKPRWTASAPRKTAAARRRRDATAWTAPWFPPKTAKPRASPPPPPAPNTRRRWPPAIWPA